jgi:hypothetical protein
MRVLRGGAVFATVLAVAISVPALSDSLTTLATLTGRCTAVTEMDVAIDPALCLNKVINVEFPNGRLGFVFSAQRKGDPKPTVISFFGDGSKQLHIDADTAMQPVDHVNFTFQGSTDQLLGAGSCRFSNPYKGSPARVSCAADTNQGRFAGEFISNGVAPSLSQSR